MRSPTGAARRPVAIKAPAGADAALLSGLLQDMNARCPAARFFQLPHDTSIEDYVFEADQNTFFAGIEFSSLSATNVNFTIRLQCATRSTSSLSFFLPMMMFVSLRHGMLTRNHQQTQVPATEKVNGLGFDRWCYTPPLTYQVLDPHVRYYTLKAVLRIGVEFLPCPPTIDCPTQIGIGSFPYVSSGFIAHKQRNRRQNNWAAIQ